MEDFKNRLSFKNNRPLFSYCFLGILGEDKAVMEGDKVVIGDHTFLAITCHIYYNWDRLL